MQLSLIDNIPFATITVAYMETTIDINSELRSRLKILCGAGAQQ